MATTDKTTAKGDENIAPGIGDNAPDEAFERAFNKGIRDMIALNAERAALNAKISKRRKEMKADGIELGHLDATIRKLSMSPAEYREEIALQLRYDRMAGLAIGEQADLYSNASDEEVARADWKARGRADALRLLPATPPKECPPELAQDYLDGHADAKWWSDEDEEAEAA